MVVDSEMHLIGATKAIDSLRNMRFRDGWMQLFEHMADQLEVCRKTVTAIRKGMEMEDDEE
jgi:hypothetical protein